MYSLPCDHVTVEQYLSGKRCSPFGLVKNHHPNIKGQKFDFAAKVHYVLAYSYMKGIF